MYLSGLIFLPIVGTILVSSANSYKKDLTVKYIALFTSVLTLVLSLFILGLFHHSTNQLQFVQEHYNIQHYNVYLSLDGISIYFVLLTTIIMPIALLSNWNSIKENVKSYLIIMLLLETLLLIVFMASDILLFYIFFESILPPLFLLIGIFGSDNKVNASYYLFLYTLWGSLFLLLSILSTSSIMGSTDFDTLFQLNFEYKTQIFFLYGIFRLILPILPKASLDYTFIIYTIAVITIIYASISTIRTTDVKELIAYSSVCHAAVYLIGAFSNTIQGLEGSIILGLAHGFVSSGLFICAGGILYDRTSTRLLYYYRGVAQLMPIFAILFFILALGNCAAPLTLNFIGEFMSLYGIIERLPILGIFACSSIVFSAAYTIYMFNRISFGGSFSKIIHIGLFDVNKREFTLLIILVLFTVILGIYPSFILNLLDYSMNSLIYAA